MHLNVSPAAPVHVAGWLQGDSEGEEKREVEEKTRPFVMSCSEQALWWGFACVFASRVGEEFRLQAEHRGLQVEFRGQPAGCWFVVLLQRSPSLSLSPSVCV